MGADFQADKKAEAGAVSDLSMPARSDVVERSIVVRCSHGLHARPIAIVVKAGNFLLDESQGESTFVTKDGETFNARSQLGLMMAAAGPGSQLHFKVTAPATRAERYLGNLERLLAVAKLEDDIFDDAEAAKMKLDPPELLQILRASVSAVGTKKFLGD